MSLRSSTGTMLTAAGLFVSFTTIASVLAGEADVVNARLTATGNGTYRIEVTVAHADAGWKHYADRWEVLSPDGEIIGVRELAHPHDNEQPFTRSLAGVHIPLAVDEVLLRARDSVHGHGGKILRMKVPR